MSSFGRTVVRMDPTRPPRTIDWTTELAEQLDWHWQHQARPRLDSLTDAELVWEPVPGCWNLRSRTESTAPVRAGGGAVVVEYAFPEPDLAPVTTIGWRLAHVTVGVFAERVAAHFPGPGEPAIGYETVDWSLAADDALALLDHWYGRWIAGVRALGDDGLATACGEAEGPFAESPMAMLVLHIHREAIHHLAEVALLRDLYRAQVPT